MNTPTSSQETHPRTTSAYTEAIDAIAHKAEKLEHFAQLGASELTDDPLTHVAAMQQALNELQDEMGAIEGLQNDNDMFGQLSSLHGRKVRAGIELCVKWAQNRIDALLILIRDTDACALDIGEEDTTRQWWHTPRGSDVTIQNAVDTAERAYEHAAITVQALHQRDAERLMPAITEMKTRLRSIVETTPQVLQEHEFEAAHS